LQTLLVMSLLWLLVLTQLHWIDLQVQTLTQAKAGQTRFHLLEKVAAQVLKGEYHGQNYHYSVEDLGIFPCLRIGQNASHHFRFLISEHRENPMTLEIRFATSSASSPCEEENRQIIWEGILSYQLVEQKPLESEPRPSGSGNFKI